MNLIILHYHLNRGGVTGVIRNHIQSIVQSDLKISRILILHGPGQSGWESESVRALMQTYSVQVETREIPELGYESGTQLNWGLGETISKTIAASGFTNQDSVIQVHNHNLGKNISILLAIRHLAKNNFRLLLQIHDFAEDLRPANFRFLCESLLRHNLPICEYLYPNSQNIHYLFLNHRDLNFFSESQIAPTQIHLLPNPVTSESAVNSTDSRRVKDRLGLHENEQLVVYPVRAIRRKNVIEALLFAACNENVRLAITLPAESEQEVKTYRRNRQLAEKLRLAVTFEAGLKGIDYPDLINASDYVFTSSVAEGFGMVFLECWLSGKQLVGRNLPEITVDFSVAELDLSTLYERLLVPTSWFDLKREVRQQQEIYLQVVKQFAGNDDLQPKAGSLAQIETQLDGEFVDFARLTSQTQAEILTLVREDEKARKYVLKKNPLFKLPEQSQDLISSNAAVVRSRFSEKPFAELLSGVFDKLSPTPQTSPQITAGFAHDQVLLQAFLNPENFIPSRVEN